MMIRSIYVPGISRTTQFVPAFFLSLALLAAGCAGGGSGEKQPGTGPEPAARQTAPQEAKTILFFGNSLTAGYGLDDPGQSFPSLIQDTIQALKLPYKVINGGLSGETSAAGLSRIDWLLKQKIDVFVLELGANDGLRGLPVAQTRKNLQGIINKVRAKYPECRMVLAGMQVPPNMGSRFAADFKAMFRDLAEENRMALVPFLLEGVGGESRLNQPDGIHPTAEGHRILADNVWKILEKELRN